jgi:hypothetical protein
MEPGVVTALRSKWLAVLVHLGLWALLALILFELGSTGPEYRQVTSYSLPTQTPAPVTRVDQLLAQTNWPTTVLESNSPSPFFTTAFIPAPKPAPAPTPPPPTTKKVTVVYQGYFTTGDGPKKAMFKMADGLYTMPLGASIVTNHYIVDLNYRSMTLTNTAGQTNLLLLNTAQELEIPIK